jgi:hypothetical protein
MKTFSNIFASAKRRGNAVLEYVIIAVGIAIFCVFGILMFGKAAQGQMDAATQVMSGSSDATDQTIHQEAQDSATDSNSDSTGRTGSNLGRD